MKMKLWYVLLGVTILVFLAVWVILPESALVDAIWHLRISEHIMNNWDFTYLKVPPPPMKHIVTAIFFKVLGLPINMYSKLFPLISFIILASAFMLITKELFGNKFIIPFTLGLANFWFLIYNSINYIESFASMLIMLSILAFIKKKYISIGVLAGMLMITKVTMLVVAPILLLFSLFGYFKFSKQKMEKLKKFLAIGFILFIGITLAWYAFLPQYASGVITSKIKDIIMTNPLLRGGAEEQAGAASQTYLNFYAYPANSQLIENIFGWVADFLPLFFAVAFIPMLILLLYGLKICVKSNTVLKLIAWVFILNSSVAIVYILTGAGADIRYLVPTIPFAGIFYFVAMEKLGLC